MQDEKWDWDESAFQVLKAQYEEVAFDPEYGQTLKEQRLIKIRRCRQLRELSAHLRAINQAHRQDYARTLERLERLESYRKARRP